MKLAYPRLSLRFLRGLLSWLLRCNALQTTQTGGRRAKSRLLNGDLALNIAPDERHGSLRNRAAAAKWQLALGCEPTCCESSGCVSLIATPAAMFAKRCLCVPPHRRPRSNSLPLCQACLSLRRGIFTNLTRSFALFLNYSNEWSIK